MTFPDVPGWLTKDEGEALAFLAAGRTVLEVGSYQGRSTICMAQTAMRVVSVDHHEGDADSGKGGTLEKLIANLVRHGVHDKVQVIVKAFADVDLTPDFDLVFIDAAHDERSVKHDARKALSLAKPGGIIAFHDWAALAVKGAVSQILSKPEGCCGQNLAWWRVDSSMYSI
jgi:predicted O-methyltransferase YrrM